MAASLEQRLIALRPDIEASKISLAVRSAQGVISNLLAPIASEIRSIHDHQAWWGRQYMPDSADDEAIILRHAGIWGVDQRGALKAVGSVLIEGAAGTVLPSDILLSAGSGQTYVTKAGGTIAIGGTLTVAAEAVTAGSAGNLASGVLLTTVEASVAITRVTVATAFSGGADAQTPEEIKAAYLTRIRTPAMGGAASDYRDWVAEVANVYAVGVVEDWIGRGSVGVVIVMKDDNSAPRVATTEEIDAISAHLGIQGSQTGVRPVTARVVPVAGSLVTVPISVRLRPDTAATRAAVTAAYQRFVLTIGDEDDEQNDSPIGATIEPSRISEAISAASGEYAHDLTVPAARYTLTSSQCPVAGPITWLD
ncbi:baseplate J/gp47 family protein [Rhizobium sp. RU35A]|uniref:baseplate J/gp47 family protein n=1 Tax=Rhizobium sp. RU35A TaxID=1907414 RepID=UPI001FCEE73B|nr:baseplate J/gp47 family protein [Rhizobium sp. RU35A]